MEAEADAEAPPAVQAKEGRNVGEVRKKVEEMTWKEGEGKSVKGQNASEDDSDDVQATDDNEQTLKRKADTENGTASDEKKRKSTSVSNETPSADSSPRPQTQSQHQSPRKSLKRRSAPSARRRPPSRRPTAPRRLAPPPLLHHPSPRKRPMLSHLPSRALAAIRLHLAPSPRSQRWRKMAKQDRPLSATS